VGQAQALGRAPLVVLEFGHGTLPQRSNAGARASVPFDQGNVDKSLPRILTPLFTPIRSVSLWAGI
jgi:hypothetical protein